MDPIRSLHRHCYFLFVLLHIESNTVQLAIGLKEKLGSKMSMLGQDGGLHNAEHC